MTANLTIDKDGIISPSTSEIREGFVSCFTDAFGTDLNTDSSSPQGTLIDDLTTMKQASNSIILYLLNQFNPDIADGIYQDALAKIYFVDRKKATPSVVTCRCTGVNGTQLNGIDSGNPVLLRSTNGDIFECVNGGIIGTTQDDQQQWETDGYIDLVFQSKETGSIPCNAHTVNSIYQAVIGLDSVDNANTGTIGQPEESRNEFKKRISDSISIGATGSVGAIRSALTNVEGVDDLLVYENVTNSSVTVKGITLKPHSIWICLHGSMDSDDIAKVIYEKKSAGCDTNGSVHCTYTYYPPDQPIGIDYDYTYDVAVENDVYVQVTIGNSVSDSVKDLIKQAVVDDFTGSGESSRIRIGETVYANRFCRPVDDLGVNIISMKVSSNGSTWVDYLTYNMNRLPTINKNNVTVVVQS